MHLTEHKLGTTLPDSEKYRSPLVTTRENRSHGKRNQPGESSSAHAHACHVSVRWAKNAHGAIRPCAAR